MRNAIKAIYENKLVGIIRENNTEKAIEIANAYIEGGIKIIEMVTPNEAVREIAKNTNIVVAKGGIITREQAVDALKSNVRILISPILQMGLVRLSSGYKIPLILTATTPNEAYMAWQVRTPLIKIYPVKDLGGTKYIDEILRPMSFLNVMPAGAVKIEDIESFLKAGAIAVELGRELYLNKSYDEIKETAQIAVQTVKSVN